MHRVIDFIVRDNDYRNRVCRYDIEDATLSSIIFDLANVMVFYVMLSSFNVSNSHDS